MAFIAKRERKDKSGNVVKNWLIIWYDWKKSSDKMKARREVNCKRQGATNEQTRKILLKQFQAKEDAIKKEIEIYGSSENLDRPETKIADLIAEFLEHRKAQVKVRIEKGGRAGIAYKTYWENMNALKFLQQYCKKHKIISCKHFKPETSQGFRNWLETEGRSPITNSKTMRSIKFFLKQYEDYKPPYFEDVNLIIKKLKSFPEDSKLPRVFTLDELKILIRTARELDSKKCTVTRESNKAGKSFTGKLPNRYAPVLPLVLLLTFTGMRLNEALSAKWKDLNLDNGVIKIYAKKTHKARLFSLINDNAGCISKSFLELLRQWKLKAGKNEYILPKTSDKPAFSKWSWQRFKKDAEIEGITPKSFRSNFVSYALSWGIPIPILSHYTGHSMHVIEKHYYNYVAERMTGETLEQVMGLDSLMKEIIREEQGTDENRRFSITKRA